MRTLIVGLGNPIVGDDGVGIHVVRKLKEKFSSLANLETKELSVGGIRLVEEILGYDRVIIVDAYAPLSPEIGRIRIFKPEHFEDTQRVAYPHGLNLATALQLYRKLEPQRVPKQIKIFTIDIKTQWEFSEHMSPTVAKSAESLTALIARELGT